MNLIFCNEPCQYQQNGYCTLENANTVSSTATNECYFFTPKPATMVSQKNKEQQ